MKNLKILILFVSIIYQSCTAPSFDSPCDPNSKSFKNIFLTKRIIGDNSAFCGIGDSTNSSSGGSSTSAVIKQPKFLLVANSGSNTISSFNINATSGVLTQVVGSPFSTGNLSGPRFISVHPNGLFVYVANGSGGSVAGLSISATSGTLASLGPAYAAPGNTYALAMNSSGTYLYAASYSGKAIFQFSIDQTTGALTFIQTFNTTALGTGGHAGALFIDSTGNFMYTGNTSTPGYIDLFAINSTTGALALQGAPGPYTFGTNSIAVTVDPFSKFVYGGYYSNTYISAFTMNNTSGALTQVAGSPFATGGAAATFLTVEATGKFLYLANSGSANVSGYSINSTTGALTAISGSPFTATSSPSVIATDPTSTFLYSANTAVSSTVSGFLINKTTGALTQISGSPWNTGGANAFGLSFVSY